MEPISGQVSFDDTRVEHQEFEREAIRRIQMKKGQVIRVVFLSDSVFARPRHFKKGAGYRKCLAGQGFCPACIAAEKKSPYHTSDIRRASEAFGCNVFVYETHKSQTDAAAVADPRKGNIFMFVFGTEKFTALRSIKQMYGTLVGLDVQITCTDDDFQKMTIMAYPREHSFSNNPEWQAWVKNLDVYPVEKLIAKEVTPDQMVKDFNLNPAIMNLISHQVPSDQPMANMTPPAAQPTAGVSAPPAMPTNAAPAAVPQTSFTPPNVSIAETPPAVQQEQNIAPAQQLPNQEQFNIPSALDEI